MSKSPGQEFQVIPENTPPIYNSFLQNKIWEPWGTVTLLTNSICGVATLEGQAN